MPSGASGRCAIAGTPPPKRCSSAWIEKLFDAPPDQDLSWKVWSEVLHDRSRNFLFNYLGRGEDNGKSGLRPDCADFVYFLRAYFAYKMGLPFGYSNCSRGFGGRPPKCSQWFDIEHPELTRPPPPPEQDAASATPRAATPPPSAAACSDCLAGRSRPMLRPVRRQSRRRRSRSARRISANICATSATSSIPAPCASPATTTTPISTRCR